MGGGVDGLENVVAAETMLSDVDGERGRLIIRGHRSRRTSSPAGPSSRRSGCCGRAFSPTCPPTSAALWARARVEVFAEVAALDPTLLRRSPVEAIRAMIARVPDGDELATALRLVAAPAVFTAAHLRLRDGRGRGPARSRSSGTRAIS